MRWTIMLVALLEGTVVNESGIRSAGLPLLHDMPGLAAIMQLSLTFTVTLTFIGISLWVMLADMLMLVGALGCWQYSNLPGQQEWHAMPLLSGPFITLVLLLYILLPWLQSRMASGRWGDYPTIFTAFWHNSITGLAMLLLTLITTALLPIMAVVALLFTLTLPFVGLTALSQQVSACGSLNTLCLMLLILAALGCDMPPRPRTLRLFVRYVLLVTPLLALMAAWARWQRVSLYGWTPNRLWAAVITLTAVV